MTVDLSEYVDSLKREIQPPGSDLFAGVTPAEWTQYLADAFWEARLAGFMPGYRADAQGIIDTDPPGGASLDRRWIALIVLYAGIRVLRNRILNTNTKFRAKAGPVEYEQENSATMLAEMLRQLRDTKAQILEDLLHSDVTEVMILDAFSTRVHSSLSYYGGLELTEGV